MTGSAMSTPALMQGALVEARVIAALMLREIHTINGESKLGYLWVLIQSCFSIGVFWVMRAYLGAHAPHGMSMPVFLATGFGLFSMFSGIVSKSLSAVDGNRALLTFPQVTEFDVMLSRMLVMAATQLVVIVLIIGASIALGYPFKPSNPLLTLYILICIPLLSLGTGLVLSSLAVFIPALEKIVPMIIRIGFFVSGVFFSVTAFRPEVAEVLLWNPVLQAIEMMRMSLHNTYVVEGVSPGYLAVYTVVTLSLGGFLERYVRARRER